MRGFGNLSELDDLMAQVETVEKQDVLPVESYTTDEQDNLDNVMVPVFESEAYKPSETKKPLTEAAKKPKKEPEEGAAGSETSTKKQEQALYGGKEAQTEDGEPVMDEPAEAEPIMDEPVAEGEPEGEVEPEVEAFGGLGIKEEMSKSMSEGLNPTDVVDDEPMKKARDQFDTVQQAKKTFLNMDNVYTNFTDVPNRTAVSTEPFKDVPKQMKNEKRVEAPKVKIPKGW